MSEGAPERLTTDQAVALLDAAPQTEPAAVAAPAPEPAAVEPESPEQDTEATPEAEETAEPEEVIDGADAGEVEPATAIDPPAFWDQAAKDQFATYPPEMQQLLSDRWKEGERTINSKLEEAANVRKEAESKTAEFARLKAQVEAALPKAQQALERWAKVDWVAWSQQDPEAAMQGRMLFEQEREQVSQLETAQREATEKVHQDFSAKVGAELATIPAFSDPKTGPERLQNVIKFAIEQGATPEQLRWATGAEFSLLHDAMQFRNGQQKLAAKPAPAKPAATVRPSPAQAPQAPQQRAVATVRQQFAKKPTVDSAVALLDALDARRATQ